jgi:hypothetical protein
MDYKHQILLDQIAESYFRKEREKEFRAILKEAAEKREKKGFKDSGSG